jgi:hypothetical protein
MSATVAVSTAMIARGATSSMASSMALAWVVPYCMVQGMSRDDVAFQSIMVTLAMVFTILKWHIHLLNAVVIGRVSSLLLGNSTIVLDMAVVVLHASKVHKLVKRDV